MKKIIFAVLVAILIGILALGLTGCVPGTWVKGNGQIETRDFPLTGFSRIEVYGTFNITVTQASDYKVSVTTSNNLFNYVEVDLVGDLLRIHPRPTVSFHMSDFKATVAMPELIGFNISGASTGAISGFVAGSDTVLEVSGASKLNISNVKFGDFAAEVNGASVLNGTAYSNNINAEISGASTFELAGSANAGTLNGSGASSLRLSGFKVTNADVTLSGASNCTIDVSGKLDAEVTGASRLIYSGNPVLGNVNVSGASTMKKQ